MATDQQDTGNQEEPEEDVNVPVTIKTKSQDDPASDDSSKDDVHLVTFLDEKDEASTAVEPKVESKDDEVKPLVAAIPEDKTTKKKHRFPRPEQIFPKFIRTKLGKAARPIGVILILLILGGGTWLGIFEFTGSSTPSNVPIGSFHLVTTKFKVLSTEPSKNQANVSPTTPITIQFSQPVNPQKLNGNLFLTPSVPGKYTQGKTSSQVVFTPSTPFAQGTKVGVMLNGSYQSYQGAQLGPDYAYSFTTSLPQGGAVFQDSNGLIDTVSSAQAGQQQSYTVQYGNGVAPGETITLYKADMDELLSSLVYQNQATGGGQDDEFLDNPINTTDMQVVSTKTGINNNDSYNVTEQDGIYLAVVTNSQNDQIGNVWIDYSDFGVITRQDDQKMVLDAQNLTTSADVPATVQLYSLNNAVTKLSSATVDGLTTLSTPYSQPIDVVVASDGTSQAIVPISVPYSQGHIRVDQNLSNEQTIFGVTDQSTYTGGETVQYSGYVRANNDAQYGPLGKSTLSLYVAQYPGETPLASFNVNVDSNGMFSGSFQANSSWLGSDSSDQFEIYSAGSNSNQYDDTQVASFTVTSASKQPSSVVSVSFSKASYLPSDTIQATIKAVNASGSPMANAQVTASVYSEDYYENNPTANLDDLDNLGAQAKDSPSLVQLNSSGVGTLTINPANLVGDGTSQLVTVQAGVNGATGAGSEGGATTVVHQGNGVLTFGVGRSVVAPGAQLVGRVYATNLSGSPLANTQVNYTLEDQDNSNAVISKGSVTTDSNGYAQISVSVPSSIQNYDDLTLQASMNDSDGNTIVANSYYFVETSSGIFDTSGAELQDLDVSGSSGSLTVGQTVNLTINSPAALNAMVTMDRGRIYNPQMVQLQQGSNSFSFKVTAALAPSFNLTFNYFENGVYHSEGVQFTVTNPAQQANIQITPASQNVTANQSTTVQVSAKDSSGNPLPTNLIVSVVSANAYNLFSQTVPNMYDALYPTLPIMTNSASSLSNIASGGGGGCGGGGGGANSFTNGIGTTLLWQPELVTDSSGNASVSFTPPKGSWIVTVYSMNSNTVVGSSSTTINAN